MTPTTKGQNVGKLRAIVETALDDILDPHASPPTIARFLIAIARHLSRTDPTLTDPLPMAREVFRDFLADERIAFGDPGYDWTYDGAVIVAREYATDHWETTP